MPCLATLRTKTGGPLRRAGEEPEHAGTPSKARRQGAAQEPDEGAGRGTPLARKALPAADKTQRAMKDAVASEISKIKEIFQDPGSRGPASPCAKKAARGVLAAPARLPLRLPVPGVCAQAEEQEKPVRPVARARMLGNWGGDEPSHLCVSRGVQVDLVERYGQWAWCRYGNAEGWAPCAYLEVVSDADAASGGGVTAADAGAGGDAEVLPPHWKSKLQDTLILHTVQNAVKLNQYLVSLLTVGYGTTSALHIACWEGSADAVAAVVAGGGKTVKEWHRKKGDLTPLHISALCGHLSVVEYLLEEQADPSVPTVHGLQALHVAASSSYQISEALVSAKADVMALTEDDYSPLHFACCYQQTSTVELLLKAGAQAAAANAFGVVPLHIAAAYASLVGARLQDAHEVLLLCRYRADLTVCDDHGRSPANVAEMVGGDLSLVNFLRGSGGAGVQPASSFLDGFETPPSPSRRYEVSSTPSDDEVTRRRSARGSPGPRQSRRQSPLRSPGSPGHASRSPARRRRANGMAAARGELVGLAEENAKLVRDVSRLQGELTAAQADKLLLQELHKNTHEMMLQMQQMAQSSQKQSSDAMQSLKAEMDKERLEFEQSRRADEERRRQYDEELAAAVAGRDSAMEKVRKLEAEVRELRAEAEKASSAPPTPQVQSERQREGDLKLRSAELARQDAAFQQKLAELAALRAGAAQQTALVEEACRDAASREAEAAELRQQLARKCAELQRHSRAFAELRAAHAALREEASMMNATMMQAEATRTERQVELEGAMKEHGLHVTRLEADLSEARGRLSEMDDYRERAIRADCLLEPLELRVQDLSSQLREEQQRRKRIHNQLQDMKGAIRVYARVRPPSAAEARDGVAVRRVDAFSLEAENAGAALTPSSKRRECRSFSFDSVFDEHSTQEDVFSECSGLVSSAVDGFNVTIFAYGQTGAGKTHTMFGSDEAPGVVPRATAELFRLLSGFGSARSSTVRCSMFELYRDELVDLIFSRKSTRAPPVLEVKRDARGSVYVEGATEQEVSSVDELRALIREGQERRRVAATKINIDSSRSHLVVVIAVDTIDRQTKQVATGKLTLCDLAGSERLKKSGSTGEQMKEAQSINKSLAALGDVIEKLTQGAKHVPYRNHKLTMLLSDSIGGNAKTLMFVNCSPSASSLEETVSSLNYAVRTKLIINKVEKNQDSQEVARLKKVVQRMSRELDEARAAAGMRSELNLPEDMPAEE